MYALLYHAVSSDVFRFYKMTADYDLVSINYYNLSAKKKTTMIIIIDNH
jgi:hypothetical protein